MKLRSHVLITDLSLFYHMLNNLQRLGVFLWRNEKKEMLMLDC